MSRPTSFRPLPPILMVVNPRLHLRSNRHRLACIKTPGRFERPILDNWAPDGTTAPSQPRLPIPCDTAPVGAQLIGRVVDAVALLNAQFPAYHFTVRPDGGLSIVMSADGQRVTSCPFPNCEMGFTNRRSNCISRHYQTEHAPNTLPFLCGGQCRSRTNRRDHFLSHLKRNKARCAAYLIHQAQVDPDSREPSWQVALVRDTNASMIDAQFRKLGTCLGSNHGTCRRHLVASNPPSSLPPQVPSHPLHAPLPFAVVNGLSSSLQLQGIPSQQSPCMAADGAPRFGAAHQQQFSPAQQAVPFPSLYSQFGYSSQPTASLLGPLRHPISLPAPRVEAQHSILPPSSAVWMPSTSYAHQQPRSSQSAARVSQDTMVGWNGLPAGMPPTTHAFQQHQAPVAVHDDDLSWLTGPSSQAPIGTAVTDPSSLPPIPIAADRRMSVPVHGSFGNITKPLGSVSGVGMVPSRE
ncbi:hypothetical protein BCR44DRAFT_1424195 [Catenaria anguillulae PL171]|uniref:Uncharacterized protein n=1 Tax=Catenaria anguillulae PL171 TaxID=765915 RepID=A0A1Y2I2C5_9FUNG|nr:hypothetical protein BCR44DRAFT_1424195 [Catenaria anguillulae PL171]